MMLEHLVNSPFLYSLSLTLLHFLWQGVLVALVLKSILVLVNNQRSQLRYAMSSLAMLVNLLLPLITFALIYRAELSYTGASAQLLSFADLIQELKQPDVLFSYQTLTDFFPTVLPYLALLWIASIILMSAKLLVEIYFVNQLPQQNSIEPTARLLTRFNELAQQINLTLAPRLLISLKVDVPMAIGWLKPVVLIPATMVSGLNTAQLEMLMLHELAHIRRHDYLVNFLQTVVEILLFFHPAVLWVSKQMRHEREYCSDDIAVQHCGDAVAYAHTLADTASLCTKANHIHTIPSLAMAASGGDLKQRVVRLVGHHCAPQNNISKWFASATILLSILLLSSKPLLTMPILEIWHNTPFNKSNNSYIDSASSIQPKLNAHFSANSDNTLSRKIPARSIAEQLLSSQQTKKIAINPFTINGDNDFIKQADIEKPIELAELNSPVTLSVHHTGSPVEVSKSVVNDDAIFANKLDNLSIESRDPSTNIQAVLTKTKRSVIAQTFETHSYITDERPYAKTIAQLSSAELTSIEPSKAQHLAIKQKSQSEFTAALSQQPQLIAKAIGLTERMTQSSNNILLSNRQSIPVAASHFEQHKNSLPVWHQAQQIKSVNPVYPSIAKRKGIEMEIKVNFTIDANGNITDLQFDRQNKSSYFKSAIRSALKKWRFLPAKNDGLPVESKMSKVFAFSLKN